MPSGSSARTETVTGANGAGTGRLWTGQLDDVAIFNTALTPTQIAAVAGLNRADWAQPGATLAGTWTTSPGGIGYERDATNTLDPAITTDIEASNGMIHVISGVLLPEKLKIQPHLKSND